MIESIMDRTFELNTDEKLKNVAKAYHDAGINREMAVRYMRELGAFEAEIKEALDG